MHLSLPACAAGPFTGMPAHAAMPPWQVPGQGTLAYPWASNLCAQPGAGGSMVLPPAAAPPALALTSLPILTHTTKHELVNETYPGVALILGWPPDT